MLTPPDTEQYERDTDTPRGVTRRVRLRRVGTGLRAFIRLCLAVLGIILIVVAIPIAFVTPILPIGLPLAIVGVILLGRNAIWGKRWMEGMLARNPRLERFAPNWLMRLVFGREKA